GEMEPTTGAHNQKYFERWSHLLKHSRFRCYYRHLAQKYEARFAEHGYSLVRGFNLDEEVLEARALSSAIGALCCHAARAGAFFWRAGTQTKFNAKQCVKALLRPTIGHSTGTTDDPSKAGTNPISAGRVKQLGRFSS